MTGILEMALDVMMANMPELVSVPKTWAEHEADRFINTAVLYPQSLTNKEQLLYAFIVMRKELKIPHSKQPYSAEEGISLESYNWKLLREAWPLLKATLDGTPWDEAAFQKIVKAHVASKKAK
jgi:hypothetical protein